MTLSAGAQQPHNKGTIDQAPLVFVFPDDDALLSCNALTTPMIYNQIHILHQQSHHLGQLHGWILTHPHERPGAGHSIKPPSTS